AAFALRWRNPTLLLPGLPFSLTLLAILLAHEFGHYFACVYYRIDASLPYFLPAPTFTGTLGAFIRIRAPIYSKRVLFDVGVAGPIAGFVFLLPIGQLDGGHILYSIAGDQHKRLSRVFTALLVPIGILGFLWPNWFWPGWLVWAVLLLLFGMRHPAIYDPSELGPGRKRLAWL